jgi:hypothetical protein
LLVTAAAVFVGELPVHGFMIWGRETAFLGLLVGGYLTARRNFEFVYTLSLTAGVILLVYAVFQYGAGIIEYYGIGAPGISKSPSISGMTYAAGGMLVYVVGSLARETGTRPYELLVSVGLLGAGILTVSRLTIAAILGFVLLVALTQPDLRGFRGTNSRSSDRTLIGRYAFVSLCAGLTAMVSLTMLRYPTFTTESFGMVGDVQYRMSQIPEAIETRAAIHSGRLADIDGPREWLTGRGRGSLNVEEGRFQSWTMMGDNQYVRNIFELGIIGSTLWILMLGWVGMLLWPFPRLFWLYAAVLTGYLLAGFGGEVFQLSRSGPAFWTVVGVLLGRRNAEGIDPTGRGHDE